MKKFLSIGLFLIITLIFWSTSLNINENVKTVKAETNDVKVVVDGDKVKFTESPEITKSGTTLVPMRAIFESMGAVVQWNGTSKTVTAQRDGKTIKLQIGSKDANVNNKLHRLLESPIIKNGTTLVPVRFIGESFGDSVTWNNFTKTVTIVTNSPSNFTQEIKNPVVVVDGFEVNGVSAILFKDNVSYVPITEMLSPLNITRDANDQHITFSTEENVLNVDLDSKITSLNEKIVNSPLQIKNGELFVQSKLIAELIGGEINWDKDSKKLTFVTKNTVFNTKTLTKENAEISKPSSVNGAILTGDRRLMVSNNPESLYERTVDGDNVVLWSDHITSEKEVEKHRVFGHHHNKFDTPIRIGITIENLSNSDIEIVNPTGVSKSSSRGWAVYDIGLHVAGLGLGDHAPRVNLSNTTVRSNESVTLDSFVVDANNMFGFLHEFSIRNSSRNGELNYKVKTVMSRDNSTKLSNIEGDVVKLDQAHSHIRGSWEQSTISTELPAFNVADKERSFSISNRTTDNVMNAGSSFNSSESSDNIGHFGAIYKVNIPFVNYTGHSKKVMIRVGSRGGNYGGAVKTPNGTYLIPELKPMIEVANIMEYEVKAGQSNIELEFMHASGSSLPMAINIKVLE